MRKYEVIGRVTVANESVTEPIASDINGDGSNGSPFDALGLEHLMILFAIIAFFAFGGAYVVRVRQKTMGYGGLECFSSHGGDDHVVMLNKNEDSSLELSGGNC
jgi:hypothetical protein